MQILETSRQILLDDEGGRQASIPASFAPRHHPSHGILTQFLLGQCSPGTALLVLRHSAACPSCWSKLLDMGAADLTPAEPGRGAPALLDTGLEITPLLEVAGIGERVYAIRVPHGQRLRCDDPLKIVELLVVEGGFEHAAIRYGSGDFLALDDGVGDALTADAEGGASVLVSALDTELASGTA